MTTLLTVAVLWIAANLTLIIILILADVHGDDLCGRPQCPCNFDCDAYER